MKKQSVYMVRSPTANTWYCGPYLHREDGPAVEWLNGDKEWWIDGKRHRVAEPAVIFKNYKAWYLYGKRHREDGPAIEWVNGSKEWWMNDYKFKDGYSWFECLATEKKIKLLFNSNILLSL